MGKVRESIDEGVAEFILAQHMFFVGTAPAQDGHVNVSPKGLAGSFAVLGPLRVAYLDLTGSGAETIAHLRADGRICLMFCAFDGPRGSCGCTAAVSSSRSAIRASTRSPSTSRRARALGP